MIDVFMAGGCVWRRDVTCLNGPVFSPNSRAGEIDPSYLYSNVSVRPPHQGTAVTGRSACRSTGL
jgi:hypothetical protein